MFGGLDDDSLIGGDEDDILYGEEGNDDLRGGYGKDYLVGGPDDDFLSGDAYPDVYEFTGFFGHDRVYIGYEFDYPGVALFTGCNPKDLLFRTNQTHLVVSRHYSNLEDFFPHYDDVLFIAWFDNTFLREVNLFYAVGDPVVEGMFLSETDVPRLVADMSSIQWSENLSIEDLAVWWSTRSIYDYWICLNGNYCNKPTKREEPAQQESV